MKIAVTSQNRKSITDHAGRCRKFWIFSAENNSIVDRQLLELPKEQSFHESSSHDQHPLDDVDVFISGGMGRGLTRRLARKGIASLVTNESDPETAVALYLEGTLESADPDHHSCRHDADSQSDIVVTKPNKRI